MKLQVDRGAVSYGFLIAVYLGLNSTLNLANKYALGADHYNFAFPLLLTTSHMAFSALFLLPLMFSSAFRGKHKETLQKQWKGIAAIGAFMAANIALNNTSLVSMTLTLNQIIRASIPVFTCLMAIFIEGKVPGTGEAASLVALTAGVMLSVWEGQAAGSSSAIFMCITGTVSNAAMMSMTGKILSEKIDVLRLTFYTAPVSCALLLPVFFVREASRFRVYAATHRLDVWGIVLLTSAIALTYNVVHSLMIQKTSAVTTTVLGEVKIVGLMLASFVILGESKVFTLRLTVGCLLAMLGFAGYSLHKIRLQRPAKAPEPKEDPEQGRPGPLGAKASDSEEHPLVARRGEHNGANGWTHVSGAR